MEQSCCSKDSSGSSQTEEFGPRSIITPDMIKVEKCLEKENKESDALAAMKECAYEPDIDQKRFMWFRDILKRSEAYTDYLKQKMRSQASMRQFEKSRKRFLMKLFISEYSRKRIKYEKYLMEGKDVLGGGDGDSEGRDPLSILDEDMLNVAGEVVSMKQPFTLVNTSLRPYQLEGFNWLKVLFEFGINGILADEMGLGKTIQCISVIAHLYEMGVNGHYLIVAPLSTLSNWLIEFERFAPKIPVLLYHGDRSTRHELRKKFTPVKFLDIKVPPVIITSYEVAMNDRSYLDKFSWRYLVVDEGHRLKNYKCRLVRELKLLKSSCRLLLTGTPLQNNLTELWSLMNFLLPEVFEDLTSFQSWFDCEAMIGSGNCSKIIQQEREQQVLSTMHRILRPFLLRRLKSDVEIDLPPKKEMIVYAPFTSIQEEYYKATLAKTIHKLLDPNEFEDEEECLNFTEEDGGEAACGNGIKKTVAKEEVLGKGKRRKSTGSDSYGLRSSDPPPRKRIKTVIPTGRVTIKMKNTAMQLRKIVNHPYLINFPLDPVTEQVLITEDLVTSCGKMLVLDAMLSKLHSRGHRVLLFSQMTQLMDILEEYLELRNYSFLRLDGSSRIEERKIAIDLFNKRKAFIFLISTRAGGLGINLTTADTVIIYDSDWNPHVDTQAMDRCHRIGQKSPVVIYRLITAGTIDERILDIATAKKKLGMLIIEKGKFKEKKENVAGISIEELQDLLECTDNQMRIQPNGFVFSDSELESLLDRSDMSNGKEDSFGADSKPVPKMQMVEDCENTPKKKNKAGIVGKVESMSKVYKILKKTPGSSF